MSDTAQIMKKIELFIAENKDTRKNIDDIVSSLLF